MDDVLKSGYYESSPGYINVDCFVEEVNKLETKTVFYFRNTNKDIIMTEESKKQYRIYKICRFCEEQTIVDKVKDYCHLTSKN